MIQPSDPNAKLLDAASWDPQLYDGRHSFVWEMASNLLALLAPKPGERILDLGSGTGHFTERIAEAGATVVGLDQSERMVAQAARNYPDLHFVVGDARDFSFDEPFDAIFSNAVLHWVQPPAPAVACISRALKKGGRLVLEMGGKGNVHGLLAAMEDALEEAGASGGKPLQPWYDPSIAEYSSLLEKHGLHVTQAVLFARPTPLEGGPEGIANWIRMFGNMILANLPPSAQTRVIEGTEDRLRPVFWRDGQWIADYVRLRLVAIKD